MYLALKRRAPLFTDTEVNNHIPSLSSQSERKKWLFTGLVLLTRDIPRLYFIMLGADVKYCFIPVRLGVSTRANSDMLQMMAAEM